MVVCKDSRREWIGTIECVQCWIERKRGSWKREMSFYMLVEALIAIVLIDENVIVLM